ncbi:hypothetical protein IAF28_09030 [Acinetobacter baumannii]|uniref:hypothetical protein n=1 Tax=Acinetobacter baumannii TaxID=470 RepID=UPI00165FC142|nr:hypothetical protein [Acinetobacter baumannii]MBD0074765.1 hypothetical protein [Acinetobacter baumannii]MBD0154353.1 hypothetical protein [Acinetobacter baumannii]MBZ0431301.1 hypothetical protein [Acinetobacter baumannii]MBZ0454122.1 hypothetical protein [Acinetobacter baumannii]HBO4583265.1 hypothetical protein [Acinetobacter baumannii]
MSLINKFLEITEKPRFEVVEVERLGKIGLRLLTIETRDEWLEAQKNDPKTAFPILMKNTVCDPDSGELVLQEIETEQLRKLPAMVEKDLFSKICKANGIKTQEEAKREEELKNSEAGQN